MPSFRPSSPTAQAPSLQEGLLLCSEYRLPVAAKRPVALKPFLDCLDELRDAFPQAAVGNAGFSTFRDEFHLLYGAQNDQTWTERRGAEIDVAAHAVLRALWQPDRPVVTPLERSLVERAFPLTARQLGAGRWAVNPNVAYDPKLESLKAGLAALGVEDQLDQGQSTAQELREVSAVGALCSRYLDLERKIRHLEDLWRDQYDFSLLAPKDSVSVSVRSRYAAERDIAMRDLEELRPRIAEIRAKGAFRVLACRR